MLKLIIKKIIKSILIIITAIFFITTITFFLFELIPGKVYDLDHIKNETVIKNIEKKYGLNEPVFTRYKKTIISVYSLDFGNSYINEGRSVNGIIKTHFPISLCIGISVIAISLISGIYIGNKLANIKTIKNRMIIIFFFVFLTSIPTFVLGIILQYFLCVRLKLFPVISSSFSGYIIPILVLSITPTVFIARLLEKKIKEVKNTDYVTSAIVHGVSEKTLYKYYILKNSISPVLSYLAPVSANLIVGSFVIESIFNIQGLGKYFITSVTNRDYPVVIGLTIFFSIILISISLLIDILVSIVNYRGDTHG